MKKQESVNSILVTYLIIIVLCVACFIGYIMNISHIVTRYSFEETNMLIIQAIGVFFPPLGGILGWIQ